MKVLSVRDSNALREAIKVLQHCGVIVFPTETAYGLGGDWTKPSVHRRVRLIKGRNRGKPLSVVVSSRAMAEKYVYFSAYARSLAEKHWPGPLSLVLPLTAYARRAYRRSTQIKTQINADTLSLRISPHPIAMKLARGLGRPLIATSANVSGTGARYDAQEIARVFARRKYKPDLILDAGTLKRVKPSTVVVVDGGTIKILREGSIKLR